MTELRTTLDVGHRLYTCKGDRFDLFTILEASPRFASYAKTAAGLTQFFRQELPHQRVRFQEENRVVLLQYGQLWVHFGQLDFLRMLFMPLYHCNWDGAATELRDSVLRGEITAAVTKFLQDLMEPKTHSLSVGVRLEDVPEDWRDLAADYIRKGAVDLSKYSSVQELEHRVDQLEGLLEPDDSPVLGPQSHLIIEEPPLPDEEREILAKTLRLDPQDFTTKRQAMELYSAANR
jgi:hypothetical protein